MNETLMSKFVLPPPVQELPLIERFSENENKTGCYLSKNSHLTENTMFNYGGTNTKSKINFLHEIFALGKKKNLSTGIQWWNVQPDECDVKGPEKRPIPDLTGNINDDNKRLLDKNKLQGLFDNSEIILDTSEGSPAVKKRKLDFRDDQVKLNLTSRIDGCANVNQTNLKPQSISSELFSLFLGMDKDNMEGDFDTQSDLSKQNIFQPPTVEQTMEIPGSDTQENLQQFEINNNDDFSLQETTPSLNESSSSPPSSEDIWDIESFERDTTPYESINFSNLVDEIDGYLVQQQLSVDSSFEEGKAQTFEDTKTEEIKCKVDKLCKEETPSETILEANDTLGTLTNDEIIEKAINEGEVLQNVPQIDLNTRGIQLLVEALQTQSFMPIVYLLLSSLNKNVANSISHNNNDEIFSNVSSPTTSVHELSSQNSFDSDQYSDYGEFSPSTMDNNNKYSNEMNLSYEQTEQNLDFFQSVQNVFEINESIFANNVNKERGKKRSAVDAIPVTSRKIPRIEERTRNFQENKEIDNIIENFIYQTEKCDLQTFEKILEKESAAMRDNDIENITKTYKNASTETRRIRDNDDYVSYKMKKTTSLKEPSKGTRVINREVVDKGQQVDIQEKKRGNKHPTLRPGPNKCYHLWDFLRDLLNGTSTNHEAYMGVIQWVDKEREEFKLIDTKRLAELWGAKKRLENMNYDKLSRSLRYYIKLDILRKVPGKRLHFQFGNGRMWRKLDK